MYKLGTRLLIFWFQKYNDRRKCQHWLLNESWNQHNTALMIPFSSDYQPIKTYSQEIYLLEFSPALLDKYIFDVWSHITLVRDLIYVVALSFLMLNKTYHDFVVNINWRAIFYFMKMNENVFIYLFNYFFIVLFTCSFLDFLCSRNLQEGMDKPPPHRRLGLQAGREPAPPPI